MRNTFQFLRSSIGFYAISWFIAMLLGFSWYFSAYLAVILQTSIPLLATVIYANRCYRKSDKASSVGAVAGFLLYAIQSILISFYW